MILNIEDDMFLFLVCNKIVEFNFVHEVWIIKYIINKDKSTEIFPPLLLKQTNICQRAMPRAKKRSAKGTNYSEDDLRLKYL